MATTKSAGATKLGRDSQPKYLGVKLSDGQTARPGMVIVRQRGRKFIVGQNVKRGGDDTLLALKGGKVSFKKKSVILFNGKKRLATVVSVTP